MHGSTNQWQWSRCVLLACVLAVCLLSIACTSKAPAPVEKVTIAIPTLPHFTPCFIAQEKGYFREEGLDVVFNPALYGKVALDDMLAGKADFALSAETPVMFAVLRGESILVVANIMISEKDQAIVARRDRGIESPANFKGKAVGLPIGTIAQYFLDTFLTVNSVPVGTVRVVNLKPDDLGEALRSGRVDAVSIWNPYVTIIGKELGEKGRIFFGDGIYTSNYLVTARRKFVTEHPESVKRLLRSLLKAEDFVHRNPDETLDIMARTLRVGKGELGTVLPVYDFRMQMGTALLVNLENQARWAIRNRLSDRKEVPNFLDFFYLDGLKEVKPDAVTVSR